MARERMQIDLGGPLLREREGVKLTERSASIWRRLLAAPRRRTRSRPTTPRERIMATSVPAPQRGTA